MKLYLNGYRLDTDNAVLAITYNFNNSLSGKDNSISHTNQIKVPKTKRNVSFFQNFYGHALVYNTNNVPPEIYQCHVINPRTGITIFFGFAFLVNPERDGYNLEIFQNAIDFFDAIDPLTLNDLNFTSTITWDQTTGEALRNNSYGVISPLLNYGQIDSTDVIPQLFKAPTGPNYFIENYPPSVYFFEVLNKIFSDQGYTASYSDDLYNKLILPYGRETWIGTSSFTIADILPAVSQKDFLAQFQSMFGAKFVLNDASQSFKIKTINDVLRFPNYYDWTSKFQGLNSDPVNKDLARHNIFKWGNSLFHETDVTINNRYLELSKTAFESVFEDYGNETYGLGDGSTVYGWYNNTWDDPSTANLSSFKVPPKPVIAVVRNPIAGVEPDEIFFGNNTHADYLVAYRYADHGEHPPLLTWLRHGSLLQESYNKNYGYVQERFYSLNDLDIVQMQNEERMIFDRGCIYWVNSIIDYVPNQITKVQMTRLL